jgi:hypothetical protein
MPHILLKRICLLAAAAIAVAVATGCGPGGKLSNCAAIGDRQWRGSRGQFYDSVGLVKFAQLRVIPHEGTGKSGC